MNNEYAAACVCNGADKVAEKFPGVEFIDADAALDGYGNAHGVLHRLKAVGDQVLVFHEARAEVAVLHAVRRATAIQVDFLKAGFLDHLAALGQIGGIRAAQLQHRGVLEFLMAQELVRIGMQQRVGCHHFAVKQDVLRQ